MAKRLKQEEFVKEEKVVKTRLVKCSGCGANMKFDPDRQLLVCEHCGSTKDFKVDKNADELNLLDGIEEDRVWKDNKNEVFLCSNCGAKVLFNKGETSIVCPFCGTAHVQKTDELIGIKPNALLPFSFGIEKALERCKEWARKRAFAPRKFKRNLQTENLRGVYTPCFTFDSHTKTIYDGKIGITHTRTVGSGKNQRVETWTEWKHIHGTYYDNFDDILITAGEKFDQKKLDKTSPFDTNSSKPFEEKYMLGFVSYSYDSEITDCWQKAKNKMDAVIKKSILSKYVYDKISYFNASTEHEGVTYKYVMLPVYVGNFSYSKKLYNFYMNGTNGKIYGKSPKSPFKLLLTIFGGIALAILIALIFR
ncbi:MAG: hypothetical protein MJ066_03230 [Clostridia bacterium]|nr:hypothetical protein [Clostridia bacterium]